MLIRSLTLATLLAIAGPLFAADGDSPLDIDKGRARPLIVIAPSTVDPVWVNLKKSLEDPANKQGVADRNIRVYKRAEHVRPTGRQGPRPTGHHGVDPLR